MTHRTTKVRVRPTNQRSTGSTRWLQRQLNDPYVQRAKRDGYRSRAAYKLLEIDQKHKILTPKASMVDLGSAPGGWVQVALERGCHVVGVDLLEIPAIDGATLLKADIEDQATVYRILEASGGKVDLLLSDLAPSATGQKSVDRLRSEAMGEVVLDIAPNLLKPGGHLLMKLLRGADAELSAIARKIFKKIKMVRPDATRRESSEIYLLALDFNPVR